jgi:hypothetical protein
VSHFVSDDCKWFDGHVLGRVAIWVVFGETDLRLAAWGLRLGLPGPVTSRATSLGIPGLISMEEILLHVRASGWGVGPRQSVSFAWLVLAGHVAGS